MAFVLQNTINVTDSASYHSAIVYFWDTLVNGSTGWTVSAHPDASAFKRRFTYQFADNIYDPGNTYTVYSWCTWGSTTPSNNTSISCYEDALYTSTPGDQATNTNHSEVISPSESGAVTFNGNHRFWRSDQNTRAFLWTVGNRLQTYSYGPSICYAITDSDWAAGNSPGVHNAATWYSLFGSQTGYDVTIANGPVAPGSTTSEQTTTIDWRPYLWGNDNTYMWFDYNATDTTITAPLHASYDASGAGQPAMTGATTDITAWWPHNATTTAFAQPANAPLNKIQANSNWYLGKGNLTQPMLMFNFGTTEPDFSF
jgi:hypothetical protein